MYQIKKEVAMSYQQAIEKAKQELQKEGFGVLTEIDVRATLKKKLDVDFDDYMILGACNPVLAHKALSAEQDLGLMLPCNVVIYSKGAKIFAAAIKPTVQLEKIKNPDLNEIAKQVESKLKKVIGSI